MSLSLDVEIAKVKTEVEGYEEKLKDNSKLDPDETRADVLQKLTNATVLWTELLKQKTAILQAPLQAGK